MSLTDRISLFVNAPQQRREEERMARDGNRYRFTGRGRRAWGVERLLAGVACQ